jgi:TolB-like protein
MRHALLLWSALLVVNSDAAAQAEVALYPHGSVPLSRVSAIAVAPNSRYLAVGLDNGGVQLIDIEARQLLTRFELQAGSVRSIAYAPSGDALYAATNDGSLVSLDLVTGRVTTRRKLDSKAASVDAAGDFVLSSGGKGAVQLWSRDLQPVQSLQAPSLFKRDVRFGALGRDGREVFAFGEGGSSAYWDRRRPDPLRDGAAPRRELVAAARDKSGDMLVLAIKQLILEREEAIAARAKYQLEIIDWTTGRMVKEISDLQPTAAVAVAPNRTFVATVSADDDIQLWNIQQSRPVESVHATGDVRMMTISPDGAWLVAGSPDDGIEIWRASGLAGRGSGAGGVSGDIEDIINKRKFEFTLPGDPVMAAGESFSLAVLGLDNLGVEESLARTVASLLTSRLAGYSRISLLERDAIERVTKEIGFQNKGMTTPDQAARIGQALNARRVLVGSLNRLGTAVVISIRLVDTESARILGAREVMCNECNPEDLPRAVTLLVESLAGRP